MQHKSTYHAVDCKAGASVQCNNCHNEFAQIAYIGIDDITMGEIMSSALIVSLFKEHMTGCKGAPDC